MNAKANEIGMKKTYFIDPVGLHSANTSTAYDITLLLREALGNELIAEATSTYSYSFASDSSFTYNLINTNELLTSFVNQGEYDLIGGKTGYLDEAGYCLAVEVENDGNSVLVVVLGSSSKPARFQEVKGLAYWSFLSFQWPN